MKYRVETFWYRLTEVHLENGRSNGERDNNMQCQIVLQSSAYGKAYTSANTVDAAKLFT